MRTTHRAIVIDDERLARERIVALLADAGDFEVVGEAAHGLEGLDRIAALAPDVAFIDIEMPELGGLDVVAALDPANVPEIVFITAFEQYALSAFEVGAIDYIRKPVTPPRFAATLARVRERLGAPSTNRRSSVRDGAVAAIRSSGFRTRFVVRHGDVHAFVAVNDVDWIDAADNYVRLHVGPRRYLHRGTMRDAESELDPAVFVRIHRSAIVNAGRIASIGNKAGVGYVVVLQNGVKLRTSRGYAERVRRLVRR